MRPDLYIDLVRAMERPVSPWMIEDLLRARRLRRTPPEWYLHNAYTVPKHDRCC
jgi:hypothetical protein